MMRRSPRTRPGKRRTEEAVAVTEGAVDEAVADVVVVVVVDAAGASRGSKKRGLVIDKARDRGHV